MKLIELVEVSVLKCLPQKRNPRYGYFNKNKKDDDDTKEDTEEDTEEESDEDYFDFDDDDDDSDEDDELFGSYSVQDLIDGEERLQNHLSNFSCVLRELNLVNK